MDHVEDLRIDGQHEQQRRQHPAKKVEIDHVVHADDGFEPTGYNEVRADGAVLLEIPQVVPAQHGCESHDEGHRPANHHCQPCSPGGHHPLVPAGVNTVSYQHFLSLC